MSARAKQSLLGSAAVSAVIFVVIALATGGSVGFALVGGLICAAVSAVIGLTINRAKATSPPR